MTITYSLDPILGSVQPGSWVPKTQIQWGHITENKDGWVMVTVQPSCSGMYYLRYVNKSLPYFYRVSSQVSQSIP